MNNYLNWDDQKIEKLINDIYGGRVSKKALPMDLYEAILEKMDDALMDGFGGIGDSIDQRNLFIDFSENIKKFSFAKTFQQVNDMGNFILDDKGDQISFTDFKKKAKNVFEIYNENWLETEFNTAKSIAVSAREWTQIVEDSDVLPLLRYVTVGDGRVRNSHKSLDGIIRPVKDPFWSKYYPPNDFNCRCIVEQLEEGEVSEVKGLKPDEVNPLFANNPAVTGEVFSVKDHPYFNGLGDLLNQPIKDILPKPKPVPKVKEKYSFKNRNEAKAAIIRDIADNTPLKINKVTVSTGLSMEDLGRRADQIKELFTDYKLSASRIDFKGTDIVLKSTKSMYGVVSSGRMRADQSTYIAKINFGDKNDLVGSIRKDPKKEVIEKMRFSAAVDPDKADLYTTTHEFAHVISTTYTRGFGDVNDIDFFKSLEDIRTDYYAEMNAISKKYADDRQKSLDARYEISIGRYAGTNLNEFMAEGFTEYKLHSKPSKYAKLIGELIDKHYKR